MYKWAKKLIFILSITIQCLLLVRWLPFSWCDGPTACISTATKPSLTVKHQIWTTNIATHRKKHPFIVLKNQQQAVFSITHNNTVGHNLEKQQDITPTTITWEQTDLAGLGIDVPFCEELLHNSHVLWTFHSCECSQHDGRVTCFVLLIHVTHFCSDGGRLPRGKGKQKDVRKKEVYILTYLLVVLANSIH